MELERYFCTQCGTTQSRDNLTVKKAAFFEMGVGGRAIRSRVVDWLCPDCCCKDEDWNRQAFKAPGNKPPRLRPVNG